MYYVLCVSCVSAVYDVVLILLEVPACTCISDSSEEGMIIQYNNRLLFNP